MKHTNFYDEVEIHESTGDYVVLGLTILAVIISIGFILWSPDIEAIGTWVYNTLN